MAQTINPAIGLPTQAGPARPPAGEAQQPADSGQRAAGGPVAAAPAWEHSGQPAWEHTGQPGWGGWANGYHPAGFHPAAYPAGHPAPVALTQPGGAPVAAGRFSGPLLRLAGRMPGWAGPAAVLACFASAAAYVLYADPTRTDADAVSTCLVKLTTGFDCPGCGGTRAFYYLLHGNIPAAARHHVLFTFSVPFLVYLYVAWAAERAFGRRLPPLRISPTAISAMLAAWAVFSVLRNLPWAPFTWLYV